METTEFVANFDIEQVEFDAVLEINPTGTVWGDISGDIANQEDLKNALNGKQDVLTAGDNITINNNVISATDTTYTAGTGISIENGVISNTQTSAEWGNIQGNISDQTDLKNEIDTLSGQIDSNHREITSISTTIQGYGDIVTYNASNFATSSQGNLADSAIQPNDNITELNNNAGYITSSDLPTLEDLTTSEQLNAINSGATTTNIGQIATNTQNISDEITNRQNADNSLQSQIDALVVSSDVFDVVGTYAELQAYDISTVPVNDIIKVLVDSTHDNAATYYRCIENDDVKSWSYIGAEGAYYTKSEADGRFVPFTRTVNNKALSTDITLTARDVGALSSDTVIGNGTLTIQKNSTTIDTFGANATINKTVNITVPTDTSDLTNNAGFITGINSTDVTTALGYTPVNSSSLATVATTGDYDDLTNKPIIDSALSTTSTNAVQNKIITEALTDYENLIPVTYSELVTLKTGGNLVEGAFYRITDYVTTCNGHTPMSGEPTKSAGHAFDIIIQAVGSSNLAEIGTAALHSGDTYFASQNLGAWQIWYDINNDTTKYYWADTTNGKGVIYRLIDEWNNDLPYDFKNIQFYRNGSASKYSAVASQLTSSDGYYYTFSKNTNGTITDYSIIGGSYCQKNVLEPYAWYDGTALNNIIFVVTTQVDVANNYYSINSNSNTHCIVTGFQNNTFGAYNYENITADSCQGNQIGGSFHNNVFKGAVYYNIIGNFAYSNTFTGSVNKNYIGANFYSNSVTGTFSNNVILPYCYSNTFGGNVNNNITHPYCYQNTVAGNFNNNDTGGSFTKNTFSSTFIGNKTSSNFSTNTITGSIQYSYFGCQFNYNTCGSILYSLIKNVVYNSTIGDFNYGTIGNFVHFVTIPANTNGLEIKDNVVGSSNDNKLDLTGIPTSSNYNVTVLLGANNEVIAKWNDGANETGLVKASITASTWSDLLPTYSYT